MTDDRSSRICEAEQWLPAPGYSGLYEVSSLGRIRSLWRGAPRVLAPSPDRHGYPLVQLTDGHRRRRKSVHRLVCGAFHGPPPESRPFACHRNGNKADNRPGNLRWATRSENTLDSIRHGTFKIPAHSMMGEAHPSAKLTEAKVSDIRRRLDNGGTAKGLAREYGVSDRTIRKIRDGKLWRLRPTGFDQAQRGVA